MGELITRLRNWLGKSGVPFLRFWGNKSGRTTPLVFTEDQEDIELPYGTWAFEIQNRGQDSVNITFQDGTATILKGMPLAARNPDCLVYPGQPYLERDDVIKSIQFLIVADQPQVVILCHRVTKRNT